MIDWVATQRNLGVAPDGIAGRNTFRMLFGVVTASGVPLNIRTSIANAALVHLPAYGITDSVARLADFIAQTANETGGYTRFEEDLRYRAETMVRQWPTHFTPAQAAAAVGKPVEIASRAYGGRMGNAPYPSDEGYRFRGMGMLQLTGRANYEAADKRLGLGLDNNPELAAVPALSLLIACDFYRDRGVLAVLDAGDTVRARKITNGGSIGLDHVNQLRAKLLTVLR